MPFSKSEKLSDRGRQNGGVHADGRLKLLHVGMNADWHVTMVTHQGSMCAKSQELGLHGSNQGCTQLPNIEATAEGFLYYISPQYATATTGAAVCGATLLAVL